MATDDEPTRTAPPRPSARPAEADLRPGGRLGHYTLLEKVGQGGMGEVYAAWDGQLGRRVAIKLIHEQYRGDAGERARLVREARTLAQLQHPNVVAVHELASRAGLDFLVMEYVEGRTLRQVLHEGALPQGRVRALLAEAGRGLQAIHAAGLVHRDFKPSNVLVGSDGRVRLMDFGLARVAGRREAGEGGGSPASEDDSVTQLGAAPGTPRYMPPEQMDGGVLDARTDQFAFAVAAWAALTGQPPFPDGQAPSERCAAIRAGPPEEQGRKIPPPLRQALRRALSAHPGDRFPSLAPLLHELSGAAEAQRRRNRLVVLASLCGAMAVAAAAWWGGRVDRTCNPRLLAGQALPPARVASVKQVARAVLGEGTPEAEGLGAELEGWYGAWAVASSAVCRAEQAGLARQVSGQRVCLEARRADADGLLALLGEGHREVLEVGRAAVRSLPVVDGCARAVVRPGLDAVSESDRAGARRLLGGARAAFLAGDAARARQEAERALQLPAMAADGVLRAEAGLLRARAVSELGGEAAEVESGLREALTLAIAERDEGVEAEAWIHYLGHLSERPGDWPAAQALMPVGRAAVWRTGDDLSKAGFLHMRASLRWDEGRYAEGLADAEEALALARARRPQSPRQVGRMEMLVGMLLSGLQRLDDARAHEEHAVSTFEEAYPADHPMLAAALNNLANTWMELGRLDRAVPLFERALAALSARRGPSHPSTAAPLNNLADIALMQGRLDEAAARYREAHRALLAALGPTHLRTGISVMGLAAVDAERGHFGEARRALNALVGARAAAGARSESVREVQVAQALVELQDGKVAAARGLLERAAPPGGDLDLPDRLVLRAVAAALEGRASEARSLTAEARAFLAAHPAAHAQ
ncbi:MAG: protein kinase, partial [Deltaproteobacteria bacterium]|nr:protein kinase [Deltaproteobacteria bacterium]